MAVVEERLQAAALYEFHDDVIEAILFAGVENHDDVGVGQEARGARFRLKARQQLRAGEAGAFGAELDRFDSDGAPDDGVSGLVDDTHGAAAEFADNFVTPGLRQRRHGYVSHGRETPFFPLTLASAVWQRLPQVPAAHTDTAKLTVRSKFSVGQRDRGTSVSHSPPVAGSP